MYFFRLQPWYGPITEEEGLRGIYGVLPALVQANRRDTKGYPGSSVKNGDVQGYGVNPWYEASQSSYLFFAVADVT